jgi:hypothetical protein
VPDGDLADPVPHSPGTVFTTVGAEPAPPEEPPAPTLVVPIDGGDGDRGGPAGIIDGDDEEACWPDGWGWFNPAEWVYRPVKCAMTWAFVPPDGSIQAEWEELRDELAENVPFAWVDEAYSTVA